MIKRTPLCQYSSPPDSTESKKKKERNVVFELILYYIIYYTIYYTAIILAHTLGLYFAWCCTNVEQKVFITSCWCL